MNLFHGSTSTLDDGTTTKEEYVKPLHVFFNATKENRTNEYILQEEIFHQMPFMTHTMTHGLYIEWIITNSNHSTKVQQTIRSLLFQFIYQQQQNGNRIEWTASNHDIFYYCNSSLHNLIVFHHATQMLMDSFIAIRFMIESTTDFDTQNWQIVFYVWNRNGQFRKCGTIGNSF